MADQAVTVHERRIARLEEELAACRAQAETTAINYEQSGRAMEERFAALSEEFEKLAASRQQLQLDNSRLTEEATELRSQVHSLNSQLIRKDALAEEKSAAIETLQSEKRALDKQLEHRQEEVEEGERRLRAAQASIVALTSETAKLEAALQEARAAERRADGDRQRAEQARDNLARSNAWLEENLAHLGDTLKQERQRASGQMLELEGRVQESELKRIALEKAEVHLKSRLQQKEKTAGDAQAGLKAEREDAAVREAAFERELATAQKLAALHKDSGEQRAAEAAELSNVVRELRDHVQEMSEAHKAAIHKLEQATADAEARADEEKRKCQRMLEAAASGRLPGGGSPGAAQGEPGAATAAAEDAPSPASVAQLTKTQIYVKYAEATSSWKEERLRNRQNEILLDSLCTEMERKAVLVREQQAEYERVQAAYGQMSAALEALKREKLHAEGVRLDLESELRRAAKRQGLLEQQNTDLGRQVAVLLNEQRRRSAPGPGSTRGSPGWALAATNGSPSSQITAADVVSENLVEFSTIQEMQEQNAKQLAVIRELSQRLEDSAADLRAELEGEKAELRRRGEAEIRDLQRQRAEQEEVVQQVARQRDMFRKLLRDAAGNPARAAAAATDLQLIAAADAQTAVQQAPVEPDFPRLHAEATAELTRMREEAAAHAAALREDAGRARSDASAARADAARARADAEFERARADRAAGHAEEQQQALRDAAAHSASHQGIIIDLQQRLSAAMAEQQAEAQRVSVLEHKAHSLGVEKLLAANAEQRLSTEVAQLSADKHAAEAALSAERRRLSEVEQAAAAERGRSAAEVSRARQAEADAGREAAEAQRRARDAAAARDVAQDQADVRASRLEAEIKKAQDAESEALQKAAASQGKAEILQKALQKAEERAANFEFQANSRSQLGGGDAAPAGPDAGGSAGDREAQLASQLRLVREELGAAYEKAAQATSHVGQYQALAESSDEALKAMQADHAAYKAEADKNREAAVAEAARLQEQLAAAQKRAEEAAESHAALSEALAAAQKQAEDVKSRAADDIETKARAVAAKQGEIDSLQENLEFWRQKFNSAEERAQRQVMNHAETIKQLRMADSAKNLLNETIDSHQRARDEAEARLAVVESEARVRAQELTAAAEDARRKRGEVEQQNRLLHEQLEKLAKQLPSDGDADVFGVISYLRHQTQVLEEEKALQRHEADRLRGEAAALRRTVDALRAAAPAEAERAAQAQRDEALFEERRTHQADLNMVRESNSSLRTQTTELGKQLQAQQKRTAQLEAASRPRELQITRLKADVENLKGEVQLRTGEAEAWELRVQQLQDRYGKVDLAEYRRVEAELKALQAAGKDMVPRTELAQAESRARDAEANARGRIPLDNHQRAVKSLQQQLAAARESAAEEKARAAAAAAQAETTAAELARVSEDLQAQVAAANAATKEAEAKTGRVQKFIKQHMSTCNPAGLKHDDWKPTYEVLVAASRRGDELDKALEGVMPPGCSPEALRETLQIAKQQAAEAADLRLKLQECRAHGAALGDQLRQVQVDAAATASRLAQTEARIRELESKLRSVSAEAPPAPEAPPTTLEPVLEAPTATFSASVGKPEVMEAAPSGAATIEEDHGAAAAAVELPDDADAEMQDLEPEPTRQEAAATAPPADAAPDAEPPAQDAAATPAAGPAEAAAATPVGTGIEAPTQPVQPFTIPSLPQLSAPLAALPVSLPVASESLQPAVAFSAGPPLSEGIPAAVFIEPANAEAAPLQPPSDLAVSVGEAVVAPISETLAAAQAASFLQGHFAETPTAAAPTELAVAPSWPPAISPVPAPAVEGNASASALNPDAPAFLSGVDVAAALRQSLLQRQQRAVTPPSTAQQAAQAPQVQQAPAEAEQLAGKRALEARSPAQAAAPPAAKRLRGAGEGDAPEVIAAEMVEDAGATEQDDDAAEGRWPMSDDQEHEEETSEEDEDEEEEEAIEGEPQADVPAAGPAAAVSEPQPVTSAEAAAEPAQGLGSGAAAAQPPATLATGEGGSGAAAEGTLPEEERAQAEAPLERRVSTRRKSKPTPVIWSGAKKDGGATAETSPSPSQPPSGRGAASRGAAARGTRGLRGRRGRRGGAAGE